MTLFAKHRHNVKTIMPVWEEQKDRTAGSVQTKLGECVGQKVWPDVPCDAPCVTVFLCLHVTEDPKVI